MASFCRLLWFAILLLWFFTQGCLSSSSGRRTNEASNRRGRQNRQRNNTQRQELPYYMSCPDVRCPAISETCATVEFLVMEFDQPMTGQTIKCSSCQYCLDFPVRQRRSVFELLFEEPNVKETVRCPRIRDSCSDVRIVRAVVKGRQSVECPACFDGKVVQPQPGRRGPN